MPARGALRSLALALLALTPLSAHAQLSAVGGSSSVPPPAGVAPIRWPAVAYSPDADVYLAVSGTPQVAGWWFSGDGAPLDVPFTIGTGATSQAPRVAYAEGAFVVTWHETLPSGEVRVRGRYVPRGAPMGADFDVSPTGTNWEMGATPAWSTASHEALVAWQSFVDTRIYAQRVSGTGALLGGPIAVDPRAIYFRDPAVAYHAATDTFFVAYAGCVADANCFVDVQRVRAGTGELVGGPIELDGGIRAGYVPEIAYAPNTELALVVWDRLQPTGGGMYSRTIDGAGTASAEALLVTNMYGSYDANALSYDALSGSFLFVTHGDTQLDVAIELSAQGAPVGAAVPFGLASAGGNFNPRVAARTGHGEWLGVTSSDFSSLSAQRFATTTRDPVAAVDGGVVDVDAGGTVDDGGAAVDGSIVGDGGGSSMDAGAGVDGGRTRGSAAGCGCRVGSSRGDRWGLALVLLAVVIARARRRG